MIKAFDGGKTFYYFNCLKYVIYETENNIREFATESFVGDYEHLC